MLRKIHRNTLGPALIIFLIWLAVDSILIVVHPELTNLRIGSKLVLMTLESYLIFINLGRRHLVLSFIWYLNLWLASTSVMILATPALSPLNIFLFGLAISLVITAGICVFTNLLDQF